MTITQEQQAPSGDQPRGGDGPRPEMQESPGDPAARIAPRLLQIDRADLQGLRRMGPHLPESPAVWRLLASHGLTGNDEDETTWGFIIHCMALMTPAVHGRHPHSARTPVGRALFLGGETRRDIPFYSEARLGQLITARGRNFRDKVLHAVRMLARNGATLDWREMATLIINDVKDPRAMDAGRRALVRDYYRAAPRGRRR